MSIPRLSGKNKQRAVIEFIEFRNISSYEQKWNLVKLMSLLKANK
jgi:hypothetical protein